jgi:hypothetical protein
MICYVMAQTCTDSRRLHDYKNQENYYSKIVERYMKFCASAGRGEELEKAFNELSLNETDPSQSRPGSKDARPPMLHRTSSTERPQDMPNILLAMRKLREGILGSRRRDQFAQRAYMFIVHATILTKHWESYQPALLYLLYDIHPCTPLSIPELQEFVGYRILDLACRQYELGEAIAVKKEFHHRDRKVSVALRSLIHDDWVRYWRTRRAVDGYQRAIMDFAVERVRLHALKCVGRSYLNADKNFVERTGDAPWEELVKGGVGWQLQESGNVVIRKPKPK